MRLAWSHSLAPPLAALVAVAVVPLIADAVLVAPHALFLGDRNRAGDVYLVNTGDETEEVSVDFAFGYPTTDSLGNVQVQLIPEPAADQPSAVAWLRAYPRRARLEPGHRQRVRVIASPPADLPDGEYWGRLVVTSRVPRPPVALTGDSAVRVGINFELQTITSITYRKGSLTTGVRLDDYRVAPRGDSLEVWVALSREGTAAFLGSVRFELHDAGKKVVREWETPIGLYFEQHRRFALPVTDIPPGRYTLRLLVSTARQDIGAEHILPAAPVERVLEVERP